MALTGQSAKQKALFRRLAAELPEVLARSEPTPPVVRRQLQRRLTITQAKLVVAQYQAGDDMRVVAERWGISRKTVAEHLRHAGVTPRRQGLSPDQVRVAIDLYATGWSLAQIGERIGFPHTTVRRALLNAEMPIRRRRGWPESEFDTSRGETFEKR